MKYKHDLTNLKKSIQSLDVLPEFDENLLFSLERKYFDFINLNNFELEKNQDKLDMNIHSRIIKITSINHTKNVDYGLHLQNFANLLAVLKNPHHRLFGIIKGSKTKTELFYGIVRNFQSDSNIRDIDSKSYFNENFLAALKSNYPGISYLKMGGTSQKKEITNLLNRYKKVNALPGIPTLRNFNNSEFFFQGIDRFIEGMKGSNYMLLTIAEPISLFIINSMIKKLHELTSQIHSFVKQSLLKSKTDTHTVNIGINAGISFGGIGFGLMPMGIGANVIPKIPFAGAHLGYSRSWSKTRTVSLEILNKKAEYAEQLSNNYIKRLQAGKNLGFWNVGVYFLSNNDYKQYKGTSLLSSVVSGDETHYEPIRSLELNRDVINEHLVNFKNPKYKTLLYGDEKYIKDKLRNELKIHKFIELKKRYKSIESFKKEFIKKNKKNQNEFIKEINRSTSSKKIKKEIEKKVEKTWKEIKENQSAHPLGPIMGGASTPLNTEELSIIMNLPRKEINGVPVLKKTEFGRNIRTFNKNEGDNIDIGELRYLGKSDGNKLSLNINSLTSHSLITGTTGSGKSNTVYCILDKLLKRDISFLVIEPVKGDYKKIFGGYKGVNVYGTNLRYTPILRINPFKFPDDIHVLEHIDRLLEIFNATWPMYAAMPALLKEAMEKIYVEKGWDLENSICLKDEMSYPTINDLVSVMPLIVKRSGYSEEVKSNYYGALVSRLKSLNNGLYRQILTEAEIENEKLFDKNCIIDLSRIGSMETKSLLMGIIFMRMYEFRISNSKKMNENLKHITVMEEAHNLIRSTSFEQNEEYSNIQGKAVEMITNSIAEMRTYGEGFILVDQAPTMLDSTAIRNTNTKIILRLPEQKDKEVVGFSTNLNDDQIRELSRLETGEAVVYQNDWLQAVSGKIDLYNKRKPLKYDGLKVIKEKRKNISKLLKILTNSIVSEESKIDLSKIDVEKLKKWLLDYPLNKKVKYIILEILEKQKEHQIYKSENFEKLANIVGHFFNFEEYFPSIKKEENIEEWNEEILSSIKRRCEMPNDELQLELLHLLMCDYAHQRNVERINNFYFSWVEKTLGLRG